MLEHALAGPVIRKLAQHEQRRFAHQSTWMRPYLEAMVSDAA
jgi:hypothetical protein